jgi:hypothetical protein
MALGGIPRTKKRKRGENWFLLDIYFFSPSVLGRAFSFRFLLLGSGTKDSLHRKSWCENERRLEIVFAR